MEQTKNVVLFCHTDTYNLLNVEKWLEKIQLSNYFNALILRKPSLTVSIWHVCKEALSSVLRIISLSYAGNTLYLGTHRTKTAWTIVMKFCTFYYVGKTTRCAKNGCSRFARGCSTRYKKYKHINFIFKSPSWVNTRTRLNFCVQIVSMVMVVESWKKKGEVNSVVVWKKIGRYVLRTSTNERRPSEYLFTRD